MSTVTPSKFLIFGAVRRAVDPSIATGEELPIDTVDIIQKPMDLLTDEGPCEIICRFIAFLDRCAHISNPDFFERMTDLASCGVRYSDRFALQTRNSNPWFDGRFKYPAIYETNARPPAFPQRSSSVVADPYRDVTVSKFSEVATRGYMKIPYTKVGSMSIRLFPRIIQDILHCPKTVLSGGTALRCAVDALEGRDPSHSISESNIDFDFYSACPSAQIFAPLLAGGYESIRMDIYREKLFKAKTAGLTAAQYFMLHVLIGYEYLVIMIPDLPPRCIVERAAIEPMRFSLSRALDKLQKHKSGENQLNGRRLARTYRTIGYLRHFDQAILTDDERTLLVKYADQIKNLVPGGSYGCYVEKWHYTRDFKRRPDGTSENRYQRNTIDIINTMDRLLLNKFENPEDFIDCEFDFDHIKNYIVVDPDDTSRVLIFAKYPERIRAKTFSREYHPQMTINHHKATTTIGRIVKYTERGYNYCPSTSDVIATMADFFENISFIDPLVLLRPLSNLEKHFFRAIICDKRDSSIAVYKYIYRPIMKRLLWCYINDPVAYGKVLEHISRECGTDIFVASMRYIARPKTINDLLRRGYLHELCAIMNGDGFYDNVKRPLRAAVKHFMKTKRFFERLEKAVSYVRNIAARNVNLDLLRIYMNGQIGVPISFDKVLDRDTRLPAMPLDKTIRGEHIYQMNVSNNVKRPHTWTYWDDKVRFHMLHGFIGSRENDGRRMQIGGPMGEPVPLAARTLTSNITDVRTIGVRDLSYNLPCYVHSLVEIKSSTTLTESVDAEPAAEAAGAAAATPAGAPSVESDSDSDWEDIE